MFKKLESIQQDRTDIKPTFARSSNSSDIPPLLARNWSGWPLIPLYRCANILQTPDQTKLLHFLEKCSFLLYILIQNITYIYFKKHSLYKKNTVQKDNTLFYKKNLFFL